MGLLRTEQSRFFPYETQSKNAEKPLCQVFFVSYFIL